MDRETAERIASIEYELAALDLAIYYLNRQKQEILRSDPQYADYLDYLESIDPTGIKRRMSIREFYESD